MDNKLSEKYALFLRITLAAVLVWIVAVLLELTVNAANEQAKRDSFEEQIAAQERINEDLKNENANDAVYLEEQAREKGYSYPGEIVFIETPVS